MHPRHHRRLVVLELRIVRQILGVMPEQARDAGHADDEHDGSRREQKAQEAQQDFHCLRSAGLFCAGQRSAASRPAQAPCRFSLRREKAPVWQYCHEIARDPCPHRLWSLRFLFKLRPAGGSCIAIPASINWPRRGCRRRGWRNKYRWPEPPKPPCGRARYRRAATADRPCSTHSRVPPGPTARRARAAL